MVFLDAFQSLPIELKQSDLNGTFLLNVFLFCLTEIAVKAIYMQQFCYLPRP